MVFTAAIAGWAELLIIMTKTGNYSLQVTTLTIRQLLKLIINNTL